MLQAPTALIAAHLTLRDAVISAETALREVPLSGDTRVRFELAMGFDHWASSHPKAAAEHKGYVNEAEIAEFQEAFVDKLTRIAEFNSVVRGVVCKALDGSQWLRVEDQLFLPLQVGNKEVLRRSWWDAEEPRQLAEELRQKPAAQVSPARDVEEVEDFVSPPEVRSLEPGSGALYEVVCERLPLRKAPHPKAPMQGTRRQGQILELFDARLDDVTGEEERFIGEGLAVNGTDLDGQTPLACARQKEGWQGLVCCVLKALHGHDFEAPRIHRAYDELRGVTSSEVQNIPSRVEALLQEVAPAAQLEKLHVSSSRTDFGYRVLQKAPVFQEPSMSSELLGHLPQHQLVEVFGYDMMRSFGRVRVKPRDGDAKDGEPGWVLLEDEFKGDLLKAVRV
eukprot:g13947.t1